MTILARRRRPGGRISLDDKLAINIESMNAMKVLAIGLLVIVATANGDSTASANELGYNPPEKIILADCDENAMEICRQQWHYCSDICTGSTGATADTCWTGCVNRYRHCKIASDCR